MPKFPITISGAQFLIHVIQVDFWKQSAAKTTSYQKTGLRHIFAHENYNTILKKLFSIQL